jgi:hypothetical protein
MNALIAAIPGQWYRSSPLGDIFQVVGIDQDDRSIDIQYTDGSLDEISVDDWNEKDVKICEQPEDWVGPFDDLESDDIGLPETVMEPHGNESAIERALLEIEERRGLPNGKTDE